VAPEGGKPRPHPPDMLGTEGEPLHCGDVTTKGCGEVRGGDKVCVGVGQSRAGGRNSIKDTNDGGGRAVLSAESRLDYTFDMVDSESVCC